MTEDRKGSPDARSIRPMVRTSLLPVGLRSRTKEFVPVSPLPSHHRGRSQSVMRPRWAGKGVTLAADDRAENESDH